MGSSAMLEESGAEDLGPDSLGVGASLDASDSSWVFVPESSSCALSTGSGGEVSAVCVATSALCASFLALSTVSWRILALRIIGSRPSIMLVAEKR